MGTERRSHLGDHRPQLSNVVQSMYDVKAAPLIDSKRSEPGMRAHPIDAESAAAGIEQGVHCFGFLTQKIAELPAIHGSKTPLYRHRLIQGRYSSRESSETQDHQLQRPL